MICKQRYSLSTVRFLFPLQNDWPDGYRLAAMIHFRYPDCVKVPLSSIVSRCSQNGLDLLEDMLAYDPEKRPTAQQSLKYPYFHALKRISPTAAAKANVRLSTKAHHHQLVSNNVLPVQEKLQAVTELIHQSNNNNAVSNNNNNNNNSMANNNNNNTNSNKSLYNGQVNKNVSKYQPQLSFLSNNDMAANTTDSLSQLSGRESINDIYLNRNISQLFGLPLAAGGAPSHAPAAAPVAASGQATIASHPNVSFSNTSTRNGGAIYVNGSQLSYETANKNAKNHRGLGLPVGGYYVQTRQPATHLLQPDAKVYNLFSKVSASQVPPSIIVRQQQQLPQHHHQPNAFEATPLLNGAAVQLSARSQAPPAQSGMKADDLDLILG